MLSLIQSCLSRQLKPLEGIRFYCYHGIVRQKLDARLERNFHLLSEFRNQVEFFRRQAILPLAEVAANLAQGRGCTHSAAVITFDDGYANNLLAGEILSEAKLPWTVFVSTGAVGPRGIIGTVELSLLILRGHARRLDALGQTWELDTRAERESAFQAIRSRLKVMPAGARQETMKGIRSQFSSGETQRLLELFPTFKMLTWKELGGLAEAGVEIGSHGVDHEIHHAAQDAEVRRHELTESKKEIEKHLGKSCRFFAFPNGDACESSAREVEYAGYEMAFTTRPGFMGPDSNRFLLPRVSPGGSLAKLKQQLRSLRQA